MALNIEEALRGGVDRTLTNSGLTLAGAFFVLGAVNALVAGAAVNFGRRGMGMPSFGGDPYGVALMLPPVLTGVVSILAWIATVVVTIAAIRVFISDEREQIPDAFFKENMVRAWVNYVIGGIVFGVLVGIGFLLLIVPGIILLVSLIFWTIFVAVEDENFVRAFQRSWALSRGHRWLIFGLGFVVAVIGLLINAIFGGMGLVIRGMSGLLVAQIGGALLTTFSLATLTQAYQQLVDMETDDGQATIESVDAETQEEIDE